ncbi:glycosyltransferase family 2 protein [Pseudomonas sp. LFM046]|uniref:glycosyltransferase family 2 protein n=1 Tax=Pseudomonas sp. LFM046 TaxID=1608357 RepID=UPI0005CFCB6E|nr:glycosyltransferase family 2 protein [Pseudomonas sp. LFM046]
MKVSIVTVCYNSASTIRDTIESVFSQSYSDIEYIIVDGGSRDATLSIVDEYRDRINRVVSEPDRGIYDAMNKGIAMANGDIIGILNSDDYFESVDAIEAVVAHARKSPDCEVIFGDVVFVHPDNLEKVVRYYSSRHFRAWKLRFGWMPPHPATFVRREAYERVGKYSLDYKISSDYEMFVRLLLVSELSFSRLEKVLVRMRSGGASTAGIRSSIRLNREIVRACRSNGIYTNLLFVLSKIPFKLLELLKRPSGVAR